MRIGRNDHPTAFQTPTHKSAKRSRVLLNTPHSTGVVPTPLHKAASLLREDQDRAEQSVWHSCTTNANPSFPSFRKPAALSAAAFAPRASGRCGSGYAGPHFGRSAPRNGFTICKNIFQPRPCFPSLSWQRPSAPQRPPTKPRALRSCRGAANFAQSRPPTGPFRAKHPPSKRFRAGIGVAPAPRSPFPKRRTGFASSGKQPYVFSGQVRGACGRFPGGVRCYGYQ